MNTTTAPMPIHWCSRPGCQREAASDDILCGLHRAGRKRSVAASRPVMPAHVSKVMRYAALREVLAHMDALDAPANPLPTDVRWGILRDYLRGQVQ